jgi:hypothetical protein
MTLHAGKSKRRTTNEETRPRKDGYQDKGAGGPIGSTRPIEGSRPCRHRIRIRRTYMGGKRWLRTVKYEDDFAPLEGTKSLQQKPGECLTPNPRTMRKQHATDPHRPTDTWIAIPKDRDTLTTMEKPGYKIGSEAGGIPRTIPTTIIHIPPRNVVENERQPREWIPVRSELVDFRTVRKDEVSFPRIRQPEAVTYHGMHGHKDDSNKHRKRRHEFGLDHELVWWISENPTRLANARQDMVKWTRYMTNAMQDLLGKVSPKCLSTIAKRVRLNQHIMSPPPPISFYNYNTRKRSFCNVLKNLRELYPFYIFCSLLTFPIDLIAHE